MKMAIVISDDKRWEEIETELTNANYKKNIDYNSFPSILDEKDKMIDFSEYNVLLLHESDINNNGEFLKDIKSFEGLIVKFSGGYDGITQKTATNILEINYTYFVKGIGFFLNNYFANKKIDINLFKDVEMSISNQEEIEESQKSHRKLPQIYYPKILKILKEMSCNKKILFIDDDICSSDIEKYKTNSLNILNTTNELKQHLNKKYDIAILDIELNDIETKGYDILKAVKSKNTKIKAVMLSGYDGFKEAYKAYSNGANHFISKQNFNIDYLKAILSLIDIENAPLLIGKSKTTMNMYNDIILHSKFKNDILILGENGTGKEIIASSISSLSKIRGKFISKNCSGIPDGLFESEMFGYEKGAYSDALKNGKKSPFEEAENGILFLDEIGDLPINQQTKLLRVIQEREVMPVGSLEVKKFNTRLLFATNKDLKTAIKNGEFRVDFYYRITGAVIYIPPLRERVEDLEILIAFFCNKFIKKNEIKDIEKISLNKESFEKLKNYNFPGNIRELEKIVTQSIFNMIAEKKKELFFKIEKTNDIVEKKEIKYILVDEIISLLKDGVITIKGINKELKIKIIKYFLKQNKTNNEIAKIFNVGVQSLRNLRSDLKV